MVSTTQIEVLKWLVNGWEASEDMGIVKVNGQKVCNSMTIISMMKKGLVVSRIDGRIRVWKITPKGQQVYLKRLSNK